MLVNTAQAADMALAARDRAVLAWADAIAKEQPPLPSIAVEPSTSTISLPVVSVASAPSPWPCISNAETSNVAAPGPVYWTVFGVVTDVIEDYGTPDEQAAIFNGTASYQTQLDVVSRFAALHGFGGWGTLTKQKCGL